MTLYPKIWTGDKTVWSVLKYRERICHLGYKSYVHISSPATRRWVASHRQYSGGISRWMGRLWTEFRGRISGTNLIDDFKVERAGIELEKITGIIVWSDSDVIRATDSSSDQSSRLEDSCFVLGCLLRPLRPGCKPFTRATRNFNRPSAMDISKYWPARPFEFYTFYKSMLGFEVTWVLLPNSKKGRLGNIWYS